LLKPGIITGREKERAKYDDLLSVRTTAMPLEERKCVIL